MKSQPPKIQETKILLDRIIIKIGFSMKMLPGIKDAILFDPQNPWGVAFTVQEGVMPGAFHDSRACSRPRSLRSLREGGGGIPNLWPRYPPLRRNGAFH